MMVMSSFTDTEKTPQAAWETRRLDRVLGVVRLDQLPVAVRVGCRVEERSVGVASAVQLDGHQRLLGAWLTAPGCDDSALWGRALGELRGRGALDAFVVSCSDRRWQPDAARAAWPLAFVDTTVVALLRSAVGLATWQDRRRVLPMLRDVVTAVDEAALGARVDAVEAAWGHRYAAVVARCRRGADGLRGLLAVDPALRQVMAASNGITHFEKDLRRAAKDTVLTGEHTSVRSLIAATGVNPQGELTSATQGWNRALNALALTQADRFCIVNG